MGNQKEKLQILWWLKSRQVKEQQELGKRLGTDTSTVTRWLQKYRLGGLSGLLEIKKAPEVKRKINDDAIAALKQELETVQGFSSYGCNSRVVETPTWAGYRVWNSLYLGSILIGCEIKSTTSSKLSVGRRVDI